MRKSFKRTAEIIITVLMLLSLLPAGLAMGSAETFSSEAVIPAIDAGIAPLSISGPTTVEVGSTITLTGGGSNIQDHTWTSSNTAFATVTGNGTQATVTGVSAGPVTITHTYGRYYPQTETYDITVTDSNLEVKEEYAQVYYLKTPLKNPDSNYQDEWCDASIGNGKVNTYGVEWEWSEEQQYDKNIFNPAPYVVAMPAGMTRQADGSWLLPKEGYAKDYNAIFAAYKEDLATNLGINPDELQMDDIEAIYLVPYKISRNNGTDPDKHIDCKVSIKCKKSFTAIFWVTKAGEKQPLQVDEKYYYTNTAISKTDKAPADDYPETMVVDGITYVFDGWYNEAGEKVAQWDYTPSTDELKDGTVNFYARYKAVTTNVTIQKQVTGNMADITKAFAFTVTSDKPIGEQTTEGGSYTLLEDKKTATFSLKDDETVTLQSVPVGATLTINEDGAADYIMTVSPNNGENSNTSYTIPAGTTGNITITVTNKKDVLPDTGILLDSLPYILILLCVVGIGVGVFMRKRRDGYDD